ncbi:MAG: polymer-forming cytoskeletal protein [bacterium]|nr:polymer-forming cytoskeletal protein [bacterium]
MIFNKSSSRVMAENTEAEAASSESNIRPDEVDTVVGPSVNVEGDFASEGNIIVKGTVSGSVHTSRHLLVEPGAKIMANVRAGSAHIAGDVKGNIKIKESLELSATARVIGDIEAKILAVEPGALIYGKISMPGLESSEGRSARTAKGSRRVEDTATGEALI